MRNLRIVACVLVSMFVMCTAAVAFAQTVGNVDVDLAAAAQEISGTDDTFIQALISAANNNNPLVLTGSNKVTLSLTDGNIKGTPSFLLPEVIGSSSSPAIALTNASVFNLLFNTHKAVTGSSTFVNSIPDTISVNVPIYVQGSFDTRPAGYDPATHKLSISGLQKACRDSLNAGKYQEFSSDHLFTYPIQYYFRIENNDINRSTNNISWKLQFSMMPRYTVEIAPINEGGTPTLSGASLKSDALSDYSGKSYAMGAIANLGGDGLNGTRMYGSVGDAYTFTAGESQGYYVDYVTVKTYDPITGAAVGTGEKYKGKDAVTAALAAMSTLRGKTEIGIAYATDTPYIKKESTPESGSTIKYGDTIVYTLRVRNTAATSIEATVKDALPSQVTPVSYTVDGKAQSGNWTGSWTGKLPPKNADGTASKVEIVITTKVNTAFNNATAATNDIKNKATLTYTFEGKQKTDGSDEIVHHLIPAPGYTLTKERVTIPTGGGFAPDGGTEILYTATLINTGDVPLSVLLTDVFAQPTYFTFLDEATRSIQLPVDDPTTTVNEGTVQVSFKAKTTAAALVGNYQNTVTATSSYSYTDPVTKQAVTVAGAVAGDPLYKTATALTPVVAPNPGLLIGKTVNGASAIQVTPGTTLTYVVTITNTGNVRLNNIAVTDAPDSIIENSTIQSITAATTTMGKPVTISNLVISALDAGDSVKLVYKAKCSYNAKDGATGNNVAKADVTYGSSKLTPEAQATITVVHLNYGESTIPRTGDDTNFTGMYIGMGAGILLIVGSLIANRKLCSDRSPWRKKRR